MDGWPGWPRADADAEWCRDLIRLALATVEERRPCGTGWPEPRGLRGPRAELHL